MTDRPWKAHERRGARLLGEDGRRYPANSGHRVDVESGRFVGSCKHVKVCSLTQLEALAVEMEQIGLRRDPAKGGVVIVKRRAGAGRPTATLVCMTEAVWRALVDSPSPHKETNR